MKQPLNNISLLIILYCSSLFTLVQPFLIAVLGNGATTTTNVALLVLVIGLFVLRALLTGDYSINIRYYWTYGAALIGLTVNYFAWENAIQYPEKYFAAAIFIVISAFISCKDFGRSPALPGWVALLISAYFLIQVLQRAISFDFSVVSRASLSDDVVSNLNYLPIAGFLLAAYFVATRKWAPMMMTIITVVLLVVLTESRSGFLAVAGATLFFYVKQMRLNYIGLLRIIGALVAVGVLYSISGLSERFTDDISKNFTEQSDRVLIIINLFDRFLIHPLLGAGFAVDNHIRWDPHSMFLELLLQGGIIGFVTIAPIVIFGIRAANRVFGKSPLGTFASLGTVCLTISGQFTGSLLLNLSLWLFIGLSLSVEKYDRRQDA